MNAFILSVGDELVLGQTVDTNSAWISQQLSGLGCDVAGHATVGDDQPAIERAIRAAIGQADLVIISGGIGPTQDDLTRQALAVVLDAPLEPNSDWLAHMEAFFARLTRTMPPMNRIQAMIPRGAEMIWNHAGTAAGIKAEIKREEMGLSSRLTPHASALIFSVPGVPKEMKAMVTRDVLPWVQSQGGGAAILQKTLHTFGLGESTVAERLGPLMQRGRNPSVGTTVANGMVSLRINARFPSVEAAQKQLNETVAACRAAIGSLILGEDTETLAGVIAKLLNEHPLARQHTPSVATAESCTGGLLAKMLTDIAGSSAYFRQGWVTYSNEAKMSELGVSEKTLADHGAVSEPVVREMAIGAQRQSGAYFALSISGIAGPSGGTPDKPVGTVCIGFAAGETVVTRTFTFIGDREMIRDRSAKMTLTILRYHLLGDQLPF